MTNIMDTNLASKKLSQPSHTPGPWIAKGRYIGVSTHMSFIAECRDQYGYWTNDKMAVANARLIAAAPMMEEALSRIISAAQSVIDGAENPIEAMQDIQRMALAGLKNQLIDWPFKRSA